MKRTAQVLDTNCTGPNSKCRCAARHGRRVHVIPTPMGPKHPALVMPTYHYATEAEGFAAIAEAFRTAPTVYGDADLELYRCDGVPHLLPVGWVDHTMRRD
jgi:hypothetical protein